jgi:two-component system sensor histidine kinase VicK
MPADYPLLFRSHIDRSPAVYFAYHLTEQQVVYVSPAYAQVFGAEAAHVNQDLPRWLASVHPEDNLLLQERLQQALAGEPVLDVELRLVRPQAREQWLCFSASREHLEGVVYLSGTVVDITRAKENSINAQKFNTKKDATLEILSHDLAAPLAVLQQIAEQLRWQVPDTNDATRQLLEVMERTCTDGVRLIRDFVDNEFMESVNVELKCERADLVAWLSTIMHEYTQSEWHTHLEFAFHAPTQPLYVDMDINKFQQVVNNLISNAIKFTPDGGCITVSLARQGDAALVTVADTGVGIPPALQPVLFEKFTKARRPGLRGEKTNGLGMSIIQTIVELHQGRITFKSQEGVGSSFFIQIPALSA